MKQYLQFVITLSFSFLLGACSIQVSKGNIYEEPSAASNNAKIKVKNKSFISSTLTDIAAMPLMTLHFKKIDGRHASFFQSDTLTISPGKHKIEIVCSTPHRVFGQTTIQINARPGRTYEIAYPEKMYGYGYDLDYGACQKVTVREV